MKAQLQQFCEAFEQRTRNNGDKFVCLSDGSPQWMTDIIRECHGSMLPDDTKYAMIQECADSLNDRETLDIEDIFEIADGLVDVYNAERTRWLSSSLDRAYYIDDAQDEGLLAEDSDTFTRIGVGQFKEYEEILYALTRAFSECEFDDDHTAKASGL